LLALGSILTCRLLSSILLAGLALAAQAQPAFSDSTRVLAPPRLLVKTGLRLTHLGYSSGSKTWRFIVPASLGVEYRLGTKFSIYGLAEADLQASNVFTKRRRQAVSAIPSAGLDMGLRYYYGQPKQLAARRPPEFYGNYLVLEGGVERNEIAANYLNRMRRQMPTSLTPSLYVLWGTQHRIRKFALYDLNAGLGVLAPPYYNFEHIGAAHYDVAAQVNIRIYYGFGF
jgi:hypothetical protein